MAWPEALVQMEVLVEAPPQEARGTRRILGVALDSPAVPAALVQSTLLQPWPEALVEAVVEALVEVEASEEALVKALMRRVQESLPMVEIALSSRVEPAPLVQATPAQARPLAKGVENVAQVVPQLEEHHGLRVAPTKSPQATLPQVALQVGAQATEKAATEALELRVPQEIGMVAVAVVVLGEQLLGRVLFPAAAASMLAAQVQD